MTTTRWVPSSLAVAALLAAACATVTEEDLTRVSAAKGGPGGGGDPTVDNVDPPNAPQDTTLDVRVQGSNYDRSSTVTLLLHGNPTTKVRTNSTRFRNSGELIANITIDADADTAAYDVLVTASGGKKGIGVEKFTVTVGTVNVQLTMRQGSGGTDAIRADDLGNTPYPEPGHLTSVNGNLMFWLGEGNPRAVRVKTTAFDGLTQRRIFTNNHTNPGGDDAMGFMGLSPGGTGSAVFEVELFNKASDPYEVVRFGKDCAGTGSGGGNVVAATKVTTTRSLDGRTWTISGTNGVHCKQVTKKPGLSQVGTAGSFMITLEQVP